MVTGGLVFCTTKIRADRLAETLQANRYDAMPIRGSLSPRQRDEAIRSLRDERTGLLVATDVAAKALDIPRVTYVVKYNMPEKPAIYLHWIGRTAGAERKGIAI